MIKSLITPYRRRFITCVVQDNEFTQLATGFLHRLQMQIEESYSPIFEDTNYADGVVNIEMRGKKYYVLNKQTPNRQIWLSSPVSGPSRFEHVESGEQQGQWKQNRTHEDLIELLNREFNEIFAKSEVEKVKLRYE